jgi:glycosyltransferase involved in cell wall biosynthesis
VARRRGVGRVTVELLAALAARFPEDEWRVLLPAGAGDSPAGTAAYRTRLPSRVLFGAAAISRYPRLDVLLGGVDVVWLPALAPVAISPGVPVVLTLHDLSWVQRPRDFTRYERIWHLLARPAAQARRAAAIAAVSEETRRAAIARWSLDPEQLTVVRPPFAASRLSASRSSGSRDHYFLWVGALEPRKAPDVLEAAWRQVRRSGLEASLVVVGEGRVPLTGPGIERRGWVSDTELGALYRGAIALVMPSRLEGAGLPPLEAALYGTPSICSDLAVLREALGPDGAEWVTPGDPEALAAALLRMAQDRQHGNEVAAAAHRAAAARADPDQSARRMRELLAQAAQGGGPRPGSGITL